jgi:hypothetical protein
MNTFLLRKIARVTELSNKAKTNEQFLRHCQSIGELIWRLTESEYEYLMERNKK